MDTVVPDYHPSKRRKAPGSSRSILEHPEGEDEETWFKRAGTQFGLLDTSDVSTGRCQMELDSSSSLYRLCLLQLEAIHVRLDAVERQLGLSHAARPRPLSAIPESAKLLRGIYLEPKDLDGLVVSPDVEPPTTGKAMICLADDCRSTFETIPEYHKHIRKFPGRAHRELRDVINQKHCSYCCKDLDKRGSVLKHEQNYHGEAWNSRLFKFFPKLGFYPRKHATLRTSLYLRQLLVSLLEELKDSYESMRKDTRNVGCALLNHNQSTEHSPAPQTKNLKRHREVSDCARTKPLTGNLVPSEAAQDFQQESNTSLLSGTSILSKASLYSVF